MASYQRHPTEENPHLPSLQEPWSSLIAILGNNSFITRNSATPLFTKGVSPSISCWFSGKKNSCCEATLYIWSPLSVYLILEYIIFFKECVIFQVSIKDRFLCWITKHQLYTIPLSVRLPIWYDYFFLSSAWLLLLLYLFLVPLLKDIVLLVLNINFMVSYIAAK